MKKLFVLLISLLMVFTMVGCSSSTDEEEDVTGDDISTEDDTTSEDTTTAAITTVQEGILTVSMSTDYAPFEFVDLTKTGQDMYVGSDVEVAKTIAEALGLELEIKSMDFDAAMVALDSGIVDLCIEGLSWSPSREAQYDFSVAYTTEEDAYQAIVILAENADKYTTLESLNNSEVKVACQTGTVQYELAVEQIPNATLNVVAKYDAAWESLLNGSVDAVLCDSSVYDAISEKYAGQLTLAGETFEWTMKGKYVLLAKGNDALLEAVNTAIEENITQEIFDQWTEEATALFTQLGDNAAEEIISEEE